MRRPIVSKSERSGTGVDMANLSKAVCHGESDKCRFENPPQESNFQTLGIRQAGTRHNDRQFLGALDCRETTCGIGKLIEALLPLTSAPRASLFPFSLPRGRTSGSTQPRLLPHMASNTPDNGRSPIASAQLPTGLIHS